MSADIISKVEALLAKTVENGCTEAEAAAAASAAARLLLKHNLSMHDVLNNRDADQQTTHDSTVMRQHGPGHWKWQCDLAAGVARATGCSLCWDQPRQQYSHYDRKAGHWRKQTIDGVLYFTGTPLSIRIAVRLYNWIVDQLDTCEAHARRNAKAKLGALGKGWRRSFFSGAGAKTRSRLISEFDREVLELGGREVMLAIYDRNAAYEKAMWGDCKSQDLRETVTNREAYKRGVLAAETLPLQAGMESRPALPTRQG